MRRPWYNPSLGKRLGLEFAAKYYREIPFFAEKLNSDNEFEITCAFDIIEMVAWEYDLNELQLPAELTEFNIPIPQLQYNEIKSDHFFNGFTGNTIGEFLPYLIEHG